MDSAELRKQLSDVNKAHRKNAKSTSDAAGARGARTLEVPVFVLEPDLGANAGGGGDDDVPLLIDMEHQAKSLEDMVLVVQSAVRSLNSPHACNGKEIRWQGKSLRHVNSTATPRSRRRRHILSAFAARICTLSPTQHRHRHR